MKTESACDVLILGGGLAGLTLARQLLLDTDQTVQLVERRTSLPPEKQKVGESTVQLGGYYLSRVLELEEHLLREHFLKYNLRFYWPTAGRANQGIEDFSQSYIRDLSNVASYQVDRNVLEGEILRLCLENPRFTLVLGASGVDVTLGAGNERHTVRYQLGELPRTVSARWVVDATGRNKVLAKRRALEKANEVRHGTFFWWVDGLVDVGALSELPRQERRVAKSRRKLGHMPLWLATNHFVGEGFWFWVIPLHGKTSLGLVYDRAVIDFDDVNSVAKATAWISERFPLFAADLARRPVLGFGGFKDYSYDCAQTIDPGRWALTGEAGRFSDPLYSPGSDLIAIHNTLIVDAIKTPVGDELTAKARLAEQIERAVYGAYLPSYAKSYDCLGDPEAYSLKYVWELAVYFVFYVFPFLNDLFTDRRFAASHLRAFATLGPWNRGLQAVFSGYYQWRKEHVGLPKEPVYFDFLSVEPLARARGTFFDVGVDTEEARKVLSTQLTNLEELARFLVARIASVVLDEPAVMHDGDFVAGLELTRLTFDPDDFAHRWAASSRSHPQTWSFDATVLEVFPRRTGVPAEGELVEMTP